MGGKRDGKEGGREMGRREEEIEGGREGGREEGKREGSGEGKEEKEGRKGMEDVLRCIICTVLATLHIYVVVSEEHNTTIQSHMHADIIVVVISCCLL